MEIEMKMSSPKPLNPRSLDIKYTGTEPQWAQQPAPEQRRTAMMKSFNWYGYYYGKKEAKNMILDWLKINNAQMLKDFARVPDSRVPLQAAWLCRMNLIGWQLSEQELLTISQSLEQCKHTLPAQLTAKPDESIRVTPNIQDRLREKAEEAAGELEGLYDDLLRADTKTAAAFKPINVFKVFNVSPQHIGVIRDAWQTRLDELQIVNQGREADLVEGYRCYNRTQLKNMMRIAQQVVDECNSYVQIKKVERKPRKKKNVSPEKQALRFKFMNEFLELGLKSEPPAKLVNAQEAWLYDTKKRKLIHVTADEHVGTFTVKGTSVVGFSAGSTVQKTLRKPAETLKSLMSAGKPAARKIFKDLKVTETKFNGRSNDNIVILKAW
jgi:hypothetical protein